jgi:alpha-1,2-mannosyltransferase
MARHGDMWWAAHPGLIGRLQALDRTLCRFAWLLLVLSIVLNLARLASMPPIATVDLWVYRDGSPHLLTGDLWTYRYGDPSSDFPLPFAYPPFAALVMLPLSLIPWPVVQYGWRLLSLIALWFIAYRSLLLLHGEEAARTREEARRLRERSWYWTAFAIVLEPVHASLNFGQVNLVLAALVMATITARRSWVAGLGIGVAAGIKLVPAVSGLFFLARKQWTAIGWAIVTFFATIALGFLVAPNLTKEYYGASILGGGLAVRVPVGSVINQSLRGALSRSIGHDVGAGALWIGCVCLALALTVLAARSAVRAGDALALIIVVEFFGLLASPVSWSHYWVWVIPLLIWLVYGPARYSASATVTLGLWLLLTGSWLIKWLLAAQTTIWEFSRPWYLAALGWAYAVAGLLTLAVIWRSTGSGQPLSGPLPHVLDGESQIQLKAPNVPRLPDDATATP